MITVRAKNCKQVVSVKCFSLSIYLILCKKMDFSQWTPEYFVANEKQCMEVLKDVGNRNQIPILNYVPLDQLKDNSLVRFRGMIQDMLDPECYLEKYEVKMMEGSRVQEGKYRDILVMKSGENIDQNSSSIKYGERRTVFIISIPAFNPWAHDFEKNIENKTNRMNIIENNSHCSVKRQLEDEEMETDEPLHKFKKPYVPTSCSNPASSRILSAEYLLNSPIPDRPSKACLVKLYSDFDEHALNSLVDVVGFLSVDPALDGSNDEADFEDEMSGHQATNPPPSLIPRLHALSILKLAHNNPLLQQETLEKEEINLRDTSADIQKLLTQCLFGDSVAAEYLFCHLISTVYIRNELQSLGQFTLSLSNIPAEVLPQYTQSLYEIIELLLPASHYFPMTLENMNTLQFVPKKDYKTNKLTSGLLQLAPHTHLILDETRLQSGKLESNGVDAIANIAYLINTQKLKYNFEYYQLEFNTDVPVLIMSEGKSMLPNNCYIPIIPDLDNVKLIDETIKAGKHFIQPKLNAIRKFLTKMRIQEFNMNASDPEMVQTDFVNMRRQTDATAEDLHALLVLSRLLGLTKGKTMLDQEAWERAKELEKERKNRIEMFNRSKNEV